MYRKGEHAQPKHSEIFACSRQTILHYHKNELSIVRVAEENNAL
jgi:hypothetical protein